MLLEDFYDYKNQLMKDLLTDEEIVKLVNEDFDLEHAPELAYRQVYPFEFVPETVQDGKTFICFDVDIQSAEKKTYYYPTLYVWVFSHKSRLRLPEGGVRTDKIVCEIAKKLVGSMEYGLGVTNLYSVRRFAPMTDYQGKVMTFRMKEFNAVFDPMKEIPGNRKDD